MTYSPLELTGKVAVVVGGTSGIGRAIAHGLAEAGADVIPTSRREERVGSAASEIEERGRRTLASPRTFWTETPCRECSKRRSGLLRRLTSSSTRPGGRC